MQNHALAFPMTTRSLKKRYPSISLVSVTVVMLYIIFWCSPSDYVTIKSKLTLNRKKVREDGGEQK